MLDRALQRLNRSFVALLVLALGTSGLAMLVGHSPLMLAPVMLLTLCKFRLVVLDMMGFRNAAPTMRRALFGWAIALVFAAAAKALVIGIGVG